MQVGQPIGALADPADLIDQAAADQVAPVQLGVVIRIGVFGAGPARGPRLRRGNIQLVRSAAAVIWRTRAGDSAAAAASLRIETPPAQAEASLPLSLIQAPGRPQYPPQHPPFPPPGDHPVRDRHDDTLGRYSAN